MNENATKTKLKAFAVGMKKSTLPLGFILDIAGGRLLFLSSALLLLLTAPLSLGQTVTFPQDISDEELGKAQMAMTPSGIPFLIQKAESGDLKSQLVLGFAYLGGGLLNTDYIEATRWFRKGAEQGSGWAQCGLGSLALIVTKDHAEARLWLSKAAEQGNQCGEFFLGAMSYDGEGVPKDLAAAAQWYRKAGERAGRFAGLAENNLLEIAQAYQNGKGVKPDFAQAAKWYSVLAEWGNPVAQLFLAYMHTEGRGLKQDDAEAVKWATKAAENGKSEAFHLLGYILCCRSPRTISKDDVASYMWFILADKTGGKRAEGFLLVLDTGESVDVRGVGGDKKANGFLAMLRSRIKKEQIAEATRRAEEWMKKHQKALPD